MFLKNAKLFGNSIKSRLIMTYALSSILLLSFIVLSGYSLLRSEFEQDNNRFLSDAVYLIQTILKQNTTLTLDKKLPNDITSFHFNKYYLRIVRPDGDVFFESSYFPVFPKQCTNQLKPYQLPGTLGPGITCQAKDGSLYAFIQAWGVFGTDSKQKVLLQIADDVSRRENILSAYRVELLVIEFIGILLSLAISYIVAVRGMSPLKEISSRIESVTFNTLDQRITPLGWPNELQGLASSFDRLLGRLEQGVNMLSRFASDLAHEFRTPITNLRVETDVLLKKPRANEDYVKSLESSLEEYERLSTMIDRLLLLAKVEDPRTQLQVEIFDLRPEIEKIIEYFQILAEENQISIGISGDGRLQADKTLFGWVMGNVLSNAIKYTQPKGQVEIQVLPSKKDDIVIEIRDNGIGISPEDLPRIFERFYRADTSRSSKVAGAGLGLSIVKSIIALHGGQIEVISTLHHGTTVRLIFPNSAIPYSFSQKEAPTLV